MEQPINEDPQRIVQDPQPPSPVTPAGEEGFRRERPGVDWTSGDQNEPNPAPEGFPGENRPPESLPNEPGVPGIDPNPARPKPIEPPPGGAEPDFPEGPEKRPERYPNPQQPQDPYDRPPVVPQGEQGGSGESMAPDSPRD